MKKYLLSILTVAVLFVSAFLVQRAWAATSTENHFFSISAAHGQYTSLYCVIVHRNKAVAVTNAGVDTTNGAWTTLDVPGTYNTVTGEWDFSIHASTPIGQYKGKIMNRSADGAEVNEDTVLAQVIFDKDNDQSVVNFQQIE